MTINGIRRYEDTSWFQAPKPKVGNRWAGRTGISRNVTLKYRVTRSRALGENPSVRMSELEIALLAGGDCVGKCTLSRYDIKRCSNADEFWYAMDGSSSYEEEFAAAICSSWKDVVGDVAPIGPIGYWEYAWINRKFGGDNLLSATYRVIIEDIWPELSIVLMKAFPLEYAEVPGLENGNSDLAGLRVRRERAMIRHYERMFGAKPLPGNAGREGWLWVKNSNRKLSVPPPQEQKGWVNPFRR